MTLVLGLTGGIASGKTTVAKMFKDLGIPVIDADLIAREVVMPGEESYEKILAHFGEGILQADGSLDRKKLGAIIFRDEDQRQKLNQLIHPAIRRRMLELRDHYIEAGEACIVLDIPLLYESQLSHFVEKVIVVYVDEASQLQRLRERDGLGEEEARQRIAAQMPLKEKAALADAVINNQGEIESSQAQLLDLLKAWQVKF